VPEVGLGSATAQLLLCLPGVRLAALGSSALSPGAVAHTGISALYSQVHGRRMLARRAVSVLGFRQAQKNTAKPTCSDAVARPCGERVDGVEMVSQVTRQSLCVRTEEGPARGRGGAYMCECVWSVG
jgi:hypothetical protein